MSKFDYSKLLVLCIFLGFFTSFKISAQELSNPLPIDKNVKIGTLENGLKYYIRENSKPENKVELRLVVNAGSILENEDQLGLAHFAEHMCFNGTKNFPKNELVDFLQSIGVEFGADLNAYTSFDETVYILPIPTENKENIDKGFQVLEDWAAHVLFEEDDIDEERGIVLEESRMGKGASERMMRKFIGDYLGNSRYSDRLPIGKEDILKTFKPEVLRQYYQDWYRPNLMSVIVVGDISVEDAEMYINKHFAGLKNPENPKERKYYEVPPYIEQKSLVVTDKEAAQYAFTLVYSAQKEEDQTTIEDYRKSIVRQLFLSMLNNRYSELTQGSNPPFAYAGAGINGFARGYENFNVNAMPTTSIEEAIKATVAELVRVDQYGFSTSEFDIAKRKALSYIEKMYNERDKQLSSRLVSEYIRNFLENEPIPGIENEFNYYQNLLPNITLDEINEVAQSWIDNNDQYFALLLGNGKDLKVPTNRELLSMVKTSFDQEVSEKADKEIAASLLEEEPVAGKIISETQDTDLNATTYTLSNQVKVTVKNTDFKSDEIVLTGIKKSGSSNYPTEDKYNLQVGLASIMGNSVVETMGFGTFNATDLNNFLSGKTASVSSSIGETSSSIRGNSSVKDFETMLQLAYLKMTSPRMDEDLAKGSIANQKAQFTFLANNPQIGFIDTMMNTLYDNDLRTPIAIPKADYLDKIDIQRSVEIYKDQFGNADGFHFFIVGNIDEQEIKPLIEKYLGSLPTKGTTPEIKDNGLRPIKGNNSINYYKGSEPQSLVLAQYYGEIPYSEELALKADMVAEILNIKIIENLREKMSVIYGGGMYSSLEQYPYGQYQVMMQLPCGPENVDTVLKSANSLLESIKINGPETTDLNKVKLAKIEKHREVLKQNDYWAGKLQSLLFWERDKERFLTFTDQINKITENDIKETANLLFNGENSLISVSYPEGE